MAVELKNDITVSVSELDKIKEGDFVQIHAVHGEIFKGRFRGETPPTYFEAFRMILRQALRDT